MSLSLSRDLKQAAVQAARALRKEQTPTERVLWGALRNRKLSGRKFLRQHPLLVEYQDKETFFIVDFYCAEERLIIELDGNVHKVRWEHDRARENVLKDLGLRLLRIHNTEVETDCSGVLRRIAGEFQGPH